MKIVCYTLLHCVWGGGGGGGCNVDVFAAVQICRFVIPQLKCTMYVNQT